MNLSPVNNYEIIEKNIYKDNFEDFTKEKFDVVFLDPPYKDKNLDSLFLKLENLNILKNNSIVILHRHKNQKIFSHYLFKLLKKKNTVFLKYFL